MEGKCKTFDDAEELSDSCPYGNSPVVNCSGVYQMPSSCYQPLILYDCCAACNNVSLDKEGIFRLNRRFFFYEITCKYFF